MSAAQKPESTAVTRTELQPSLERYADYGKLNAPARAEVQRARSVREMADMVSLTEWGAKLTDAGRVAMAKWCIRRDVDPLTELDNVGGPYINAEHWTRKLGELRVRGIVRDVEQFNIAKDARLEALAKDQAAPEDVRERAKAEHYRRVELRAKYGAPDEATGVCLTLIYLTAGGEPIAGCKWGGGGTSVKQWKSGGGSAPNPVVESNAVLSVESQSIRRAMRQLALTAPTALPEFADMQTEVRELAETVGFDKRLGSGDPVEPMNTTGAAQQAFSGYPGMDGPEEPSIGTVENAEREAGEGEPPLGELNLGVVGDAPRRGKTRDAIRDGGR